MQGRNQGCFRVAVRIDAAEFGISEHWRARYDFVAVSDKKAPADRNEENLGVVWVISLASSSFSVKTIDPLCHCPKRLLTTIYKLQRTILMTISTKINRYSATPRFATSLMLSGQRAVRLRGVCYAPTWSRVMGVNRAKRKALDTGGSKL